MTVDEAWWRQAVIYQVYLKSFADSDGDGLGDLDGVAEHLDHLVGLGVDGLWLNPCYPSPGRDGGYDVADYLSIDPQYGGTAALDRLIAAAHERGLRVLMDIVPNHCSDQHPWFQAALAEPPGGTHRDLFLFREGRGPDGSLPPNNWNSVFGGPAWTRTADPDGRPGQWYLHSFDSSQPDFNWRDQRVRDHFRTVLRHWYERGVDGFRIDVAAMLVKAPGLPDATPGAPAPNSNQPETHEVYREWRRLTADYLPDRAVMLVGETWAPSPREVAAFIRPDELHQTFYFDLMAQPWHAAAFRRSAQRGIEAAAEAAGPGGGLAWVLNSHDAHRSVSRYGLIGEDRSEVDSADVMAALLRPRGAVDVDLGQRRARAALLFQLALPGASYLYQGEELGLPEVMDLPDDARRDPIWVRSGGREYGRDGCRVPLPWQRDGDAFGFTTARPWLPQPAWFSEFAADVQAKDAGSTLSLYKAALALRRTLFADAPQSVEWIEVDGRDDVTAYRRGRTVSVTVFGTQPFQLPHDWGRIALTSAPSSGRVLPGSCAAWIVEAR